MTKVAICFALLFGAGSSVSAQADAFNLRAKYGAPLERETFQVLPEIYMVVDYGPAKQACTVRLPSGVRDDGRRFDDVVTPEKIYAIVDEIAPPSMRGAELWRKTLGAGTLKIFHVEYENVNIEERFSSGKGTGVLVIFKDPACS